MPLALAPIATVVLRYGTVALASYAIARSVDRGRRDQRAEDALDETPEGVTLRRDRDADSEQVNATGRVRRVIRFGATGRGIEVDVVGLTRVRFRKV